jgi:hypothetical protein
MLDSLGRSLTESLRGILTKPYISFRNLTVAIFALWICNFAFILWGRLASATCLTHCCFYLPKELRVEPPRMLLPEGAIISLGHAIRLGIPILGGWEFSTFPRFPHRKFASV